MFHCNLPPNKFWHVSKKCIQNIYYESDCNFNQTSDASLEHFGNVLAYVIMLVADSQLSIKCQSIKKHLADSLKTQDCQFDNFVITGGSADAANYSKIITLMIFSFQHLTESIECFLLCIHITLPLTLHYHFTLLMGSLTTHGFLSKWRVCFLLTTLYMNSSSEDAVYQKMTRTLSVIWFLSVGWQPKSPGNDDCLYYINQMPSWR